MEEFFVGTWKLILLIWWLKAAFLINHVIAFWVSSCRARWARALLYSCNNSCTRILNRSIANRLLKWLDIYWEKAPIIGRLFIHPSIQMLGKPLRNKGDVQMGYCRIQFHPPPPPPPPPSSKWTLCGNYFRSSFDFLNVYFDNDYGETLFLWNITFMEHHPFLHRGFP